MGINLNEHEGTGGKYLDEGVHVVEITEASTKAIRTGNMVLEIVVADNEGRLCKIDGLIIYHKDGKEHWSFVVDFLKKSGIFDKFSEGERANFGPHMLKGKRLAVRVTKEQGRDGNLYSRIDGQTGVLSATEYKREMENPTPPPSKPEPRREPAPAERPTHNAGDDDDLPF